MFKLILIFLIGIMVLFSFIGIVKYYNKFMNEAEGTFKERLKALIREDFNILFY